eukprot:c50020_g1_i1 orf=128-346(-)
MGAHGEASVGVEDEFEEDEDEEEQQGEPLLSILFGNVDDAGDLDEEYLDQARILPILVSLGFWALPDVWAKL